MDENRAVVILVVDGGDSGTVHCRAWQVSPEYFSKIERELSVSGRALPEWIWDDRTSRSVIISDEDGAG